MKKTVFVALAVSALLGACQYKSVSAPALSARDAEYIALVPKFDTYLPYLPYEIADPTGEPPGTIYIDTKQKFLYLVLPNKKAIRYGVGIGKDGFRWSGRANIQYGREWPTWTPPAAMIRRDPKLEKWREGMQPGVSNPLGSRALYIFKDGNDTLYRIHGSPDWKSIGKSASSGCVRMFNQDVMDLYDRVPGKATLVVL